MTGNTRDASIPPLREPSLGCNGTAIENQTRERMRAMAYQKFLKASVLMLAVAFILSVGAGATCVYVSSSQCAVCHYTLIINGSEACCFSYSCNDGSQGSGCSACGYAGIPGIRDRRSTHGAAGPLGTSSEEAILLSQLLMRDKQVARAVKSIR